MFSGDFKVQSVAVSNSSLYLALGGLDGLIEVWDYIAMSPAEDLPYQAADLYMLHVKSVLALRFSRDDKLLASGDSEGLVRVWKFADGKKLRELEVSSGVTCLAFQASSSLVVGCLDKSVRLYGLKSGTLLKNLKGHDSFLLTVQPLADNLLLSAAEDGEMRIWNLAAEPSLLKQLKPPGKQALFGGCQAGTGRELLVCARSVYLLDMDSGAVLQDYKSHQQEEMLLARFSGD